MLSWIRFSHLEFPLKTVFFCFFIESLLKLSRFIFISEAKFLNSELMEKEKEEKDGTKDAKKDEEGERLF